MRITFTVSKSYLTRKGHTIQLSVYTCSLTSVRALCPTSLRVPPGLHQSLMGRRQELHRNPVLRSPRESGIQVIMASGNALFNRLGLHSCQTLIRSSIHSALRFQDSANGKPCSMRCVQAGRSLLSRQTADSCCWTYYCVSSVGFQALPASDPIV